MDDFSPSKFSSLDQREAELQKLNEVLEERKAKAIALAAQATAEYKNSIKSSPDRKSRSPWGAAAYQSPNRTDRFHADDNDDDDDGNNEEYHARKESDYEELESPGHNISSNYNNNNNNYSDSHYDTSNSVNRSMRPKSASAAITSVTRHQYNNNNNNNEPSGITFTTTAAAAEANQEGISAEKTVRLLNAKIKMLKEEIAEAETIIRQKENENSQSEKKIVDLNDQIAKLQRANAQQAASIDKSKLTIDKQALQIQNLERELATLGKEAEKVNKLQKKLDIDAGSKDVRLNRALEEIDRLKQTLKEAQAENKESGDNARKQLDRTILDNKRLQKQKNELLLALKKQIKLIDILKRQKMHLEAAKLIQFSEEEFTKALDLGEHL